MRHLFLTILLVAGLAVQAAKPTIMVLPDKDWASTKGYGEMVGRQGKQKFVVNYTQCFLDHDYNDVEAALRELFQGYQYQLMSASSMNESDDEDEMEENTLEDASSGAEATSNANDDIINKYKPDIVIYVSWNTNPIGARYSLSYRFDARDSYSNKSVATATGESAVVARSQTLSGLLKASAAEKMGSLINNLTSHFADLEAHGREIQINCNIMGNSGVNFDTEFGGKTLSTIIYEWISDNTVGHQFSEAGSAANRLRYNQVRIPLKDVSGRPMQARQFVQGLADYLKTNYNLNVTNRSNRPGRGRLQING